MRRKLKKNELKGCVMKIVGIFPPYIYSIQYDEQCENEFDRLLGQWNDVSYVVKFLTDYESYLKKPLFSRISTPLLAAQQVLKEAENLEELFYTLSENAETGQHPDFDTHFKYLDGKYRYEIHHIPMKSYGDGHPSLLRMYAIKLDTNTYVITGGGIKLGKEIQSSPDLQNHIMQNIDKVRAWLIENNITDSSDL